MRRYEADPQVVKVSSGISCAFRHTPYIPAGDPGESERRRAVAPLQFGMQQLKVGHRTQGAATARGQSSPQRVALTYLIASPVVSTDNSTSCTYAKSKKAFGN